MQVALTVTGWGAITGATVELVVLTLVVVFVVVFTLVVELVLFTVVLLLTLVVLLVVVLAANIIGVVGAGSWHWHLLVGITLVVATLLQSVHVQVVTLEVLLAPSVTLHMQF